MKTLKNSIGIGIIAVTLLFSVEAIAQNNKTGKIRKSDKITVIKKTRKNPNGNKATVRTVRKAPVGKKAMVAKKNRNVVANRNSYAKKRGQKNFSNKNAWKKQNNNKKNAYVKNRNHKKGKKAYRHRSYKSSNAYYKHYWNKKYYAKKYRIGTRVKSLPFGHFKVFFGRTPYYCHDGIFYQRAKYGYYKVIDPPAGAIVYDLPYYAERVWINGKPYYEFNGTLFKKVYTYYGKAFEVVGRLYA